MEKKVHLSVKAPNGSSISNQVLCKGERYLGIGFDFGSGFGDALVLVLILVQG